MAVKGTVIALATWLALYLTKETFGRTAAIVLAVLIFLFFLLVLWARVRLRH
jgi:4-amino-4-deoxy-L-arabinose transferase-like glycosyltransferase